MSPASTIIATDVPAHLVYEWDDGEPIYYQNYREVLAGKITSEEIMADSTLQAWIKSKLYLFLCGALLEKGYEILVGEIGIQLAPKSTRAADIAIFKADTFTLSNKYTEQAPEIVIEVDVKADYPSSGKLIEYYEQKTQKLLAFGVKKVIWIFTDAETIIAINPDKKLFLEWSDEVEVMPGIGFKLDDILKR